MKSDTSVIGQIVVSKVGRDQGHVYCVVGISKDNKWLLADGRKRTLDHPKVKNSRHLQILHAVIEGEAECGKISDLTIRATLAKIIAR